MNVNKQTLLVTGASGQLGRRVIELLLESKHEGIIAATRHREKLTDLAARGVEIREADFDNPASLSRAFANADRVLIISTDALDRPGRRFEQHQRAISAAVKSGVSHIVYTSLTHPEPGSPVLIASDHHNTEVALEDSGVGFTSLRNNLYTDLLLMSLPQAIATGRLVAAAGQGGAAYVTREDCARAAAAALSANFDGRRKLEITGPAVLTYAELAAIASKIMGKSISYVATDPEEMKAQMIQHGMPEPVAALWISFDVGMAQGRFGPATSSVAELTGRKPQSVEEFLIANRSKLSV